MDWTLFTTTPNRSVILTPTVHGLDVVHHDAKQVSDVDPYGTGTGPFFPHARGTRNRSVILTPTVLGQDVLYREQSLCM